MAPSLSKLLPRSIPRRPAIAAGAVALVYFWSYLRFLSKQKKNREQAAAALVYDKKDAKKEKAHVDREFFRQVIHAGAGYYETGFWPFCIITTN